MKTPKEIYLQVQDKKGKEISDHTVSQYQTYETDKKYIREDLVPKWIPIAKYNKKFGSVDIFGNTLFGFQRCTDSQRINKDLHGHDVWANKNMICIDPTHFMHIPKGPNE